MKGTIRPRETGATATLQRGGKPRILSVTGGELDVAIRPSEPGFNPLDLLYASLSACLVLSARAAASELGMLDRFTAAKATVTGEKAPDDPSRVARFLISFIISGDFSAAEHAALTKRAEEICTVSNTLKTTPEFEFDAPTDQPASDTL